MTAHHALRLHVRGAAALLLGVLLQVGVQAQTSLIPGTSQIIPNENSESSGPVRLRQQRAPVVERDLDQPDLTARTERLQPYVAGEFERYVQNQAGTQVEVRRFGADLVAGSQDTRGIELSPLVPADYLVGPGDEVLVTLWGSVDADLRLSVDRSGRISIPRVGAVQVSGVRAADLPDVVNRRIGQVFRNFQSSVGIGQLRGIRVFVTGFVVRPGTYTLSSLSTVLVALMRAGGPSAAGSFRRIELRRGSELTGRFDLYDLLLKGDRTADRVLQAGDVVHVNPVGPQVGFIGSVNKPAIVELKSGETVADALRMAGGFNAVADRTRVAVERLRERNQGRVTELLLPRDDDQELSQGDVLFAFSAVSAALPTERQLKRVKVEGEVQRPGEYVLAEASTIGDAVKAAGGFTNAAYIYAAEFTRPSVQRTQQENYDRALRDMETDFARASSSQRVSTIEESSAQAARSAATSRLIERLRALRPTGRIVMQIEPTITALPDLALEDGDRLFIPARSTTVGVFGSVFNAGSYLYTPGRSMNDYLRLAGGPTKGADQDSTFVVRANGNVVSSRQSAGWFSRTGGVEQLVAQPGDTVFVPEETDKTTFVQAAKDWTQILYQFGFGIAGLRSATR